MFFKKRDLEVKFISNCGPIAHEPAPAGRFMPEWFKRQHSYSAEESKSHVWLKNMMKPSFTPTVKRCLPFRDSMTAGYIIPFPYDIAIRCMVDEDTGEEVVGVHTGITDIGGLEPIGYHSKTQISEHPYWQSNKSAKKLINLIIHGSFKHRLMFHVCLYILNIRELTNGKYYLVLLILMIIR